MTIEYGQGNLLRAEADALVNTVNTQGVMGKGLALQFKKAFPEAFTKYAKACKAGEVVTGKVHVVPLLQLTSPRFIINFPTKESWRRPSKIEYIIDGLRSLNQQVRRLNITSIAIPPLGCGNGGLAWKDVRPLIVNAFGDLPNVRVLLFEPGPTPEAAEIIDRRPTPKMTPGRAAILSLMDQYVKTGYDYRLSLVEVQKLAYFLQEAGEPLKLSYRPYLYGPYADNLRNVLQNIEGHYTRGVADGNNSPATPLELLPGAASAAEMFLSNRSNTKERLKRVAELINGFETPFGMELLSTVHWVMHHHGVKPDDLSDVISGVRAWNSRKSKMKDGHLQIAWTRLREQQWSPAVV